MVYFPSNPPGELPFIYLIGGMFDPWMMCGARTSTFTYSFIYLEYMEWISPWLLSSPRGKKTGHRCPFPIGWLIHTGVWWNPFNNRIQQVNDVRWYTKPGVSKARGLHGPPGLPCPQLRSATNSASCGDGGCGGDVGDADATRWNAWGQGWGHVFFCFFWELPSGNLT